MIDLPPELLLEEFKRGFRKRVRFAIVSPEGRYSAAWMTTNTKGDFYIGTRSVMGQFKISLHQSEICRLAIDHKYFCSTVDRGLIPPEEDRALVKWRRPPAPAVGAALVVGLAFPTDFLHLEAPRATKKERFLLLKAAPQGRAVEIAFFYSREPAVTLEPKLLQFGIPWFWTDLNNGEMVWMVSREADIDATVLPSAETLNKISGPLLDPSAFAKGRPLTAHLWNSPKDNEALFVIEIAASALRGT